MTATRLLVVEDERIVAIHLEQQLRNLGYDVVAVVASGEQALARTVDLRPDLVLMDIHLRGEFDGIETSSRIPDALGIPVVFVTADSDQATLDRARTTGPYGFLVKPFSEKDLHATIQMALERYRVHDALKTSQRDLEEANRQLRIKIVEAAQAERELRVVNGQLTAALSERALAERALARSEAEFRAGFEGSVVGKALVEPTSRRILRANRAFARMLGYEPEELVGRTGMEFTWPEDQLRGAEQYASLLAGEVDGYVDEKRYMRRDGTPFWARVSAAIARAPGGDHPTLAVATIEDVDARHKADEQLRLLNRQLSEALAERAVAERALARSEAEFRAGFEGSVVGKALVEPSTRRFLRVNRAFAAMLGREPDEIVGRADGDFTWPEDRTVGEDDYARLLSGETAVYVAVKRYRRSDGSPFWVRVSAALAQAGEGDASSLAVATIEDIDASHHAEEALLNAKQELERLVEERTHALGQRDVLLREVYHRVKNNLQIVDSLLVLQARRTDDLQARNGLLGLRSRVYALGLVHHQLMESQDLRSFDVGPFLHELSRNILESGGGDGVTLSVDACALSVGLDFALPLGLLATELLTNSLKHGCPAGTGRIAVILRHDEAGKLILTVADEGPGAPGRNGAGAPRAGAGSGIIKALIGELQGEMTVRNDNGMRTEIRMTLPVLS